MYEKSLFSQVHFQHNVFPNVASPTMRIGLVLLCRAASEYASLVPKYADRRLSVPISSSLIVGQDQKLAAGVDSHPYYANRLLSKYFMALTHAGDGKLY